VPLSYRIDHERRLVVATVRGTVTREDLFGYQTTVWSRSDVRGYDELVDMSGVTAVATPSVENVHSLATLGATMPGSRSESKLAILAPSDLTFGLGRMFQVLRSNEDGGVRDVQVFRTPEEVLAFLGLDGPFPSADDEQR
jgi:hypothetical protein